MMSGPLAARAQVEDLNALDAAGEAALTTAVARSLNLERCTLHRLELPQESSGEYDIALPGLGYTLSLRRYSLRSDDFRVWVQAGQDETVEVEPPPVQTFRGEVMGVDGSTVAASLDEDRLTAMIHSPDDTILVVQPVSDAVADAPPGWHVVYDVADVPPGDWTCGNDDLQGVRPTKRRHDETGDGDGRDERGEGPDAQAGQQIVDLYFDTDVDYFQLCGSSVDATVLDIERVLNLGDIIYRRDVGITQWIRGVIVRTAEPDPYSAPDANGRLCQMRTFWNNNLGGLPRDTAHLMTGRDLTGNIIGLAWEGVVCNVEGESKDGCPGDGNLAYGLSQSRFSNIMAERVAVTAHELGHNWSATHCNGDPDCSIMCANIGGCTGNITSFSSRSVNEITEYRDDEADCLLDCWNVVRVPDDYEVVWHAARRACWGGQVAIDAGRYPETFRISRAVTLTASGGMVVIGN